MLDSFGYRWPYSITRTDAFSQNACERLLLSLGKEMRGGNYTLLLSSVKRSATVRPLVPPPMMTKS